MGQEGIDPLAVMLEARSVALVGASPRPGSLGARMIEEVAKSASRPRTYLVNPRYAEVDGVSCYPGLAELPEAVDLALLAVPDAALEEQVRAAAGGAARSAVIFGSAVDHAAGRDEARSGPGLRDRIARVAREAGMPLCGAGCMGFVNVARGLRAIGYTEQDPLPAGPVALVTHSGSVFSALLRTRRAFGFTMAVSSGQELVTPAAAYARYALTLPETKVLALVLEAIRDAAALRAVLADAAGRDIPVLLLAAGTSAASRSLVAAHSGALAAGDGAWQALASAYGVHRVGDLAELADTLELFCLTALARPRRRVAGRGIATVHDSGFERAHVADVAAEVGVPFAPLTEDTRRRLAAVLDPGLEPGNPLDVWGTGRDSGGTVHRDAVGTRGRPRRRTRSRSPWTWYPNTTATTPTATRCWPPRRRPASRSPCSPRSPPRSTRRPRPGCAPRESRYSNRPAPACSPSATCSPTPRQPPRRPARSRLRRHPPGRPAAPAGRRRGARPLGRSPHGRPAGRSGPVRPAARLRHPRRGRAVRRHA